MRRDQKKISLTFDKFCRNPTLAECHPSQLFTIDTWKFVHVCLYLFD